MKGLQGAVLSPDGSRVATFSFEHIARIWDANTGQPLTPALRHEGAVDQAAFSPDGTLLATAAADSRVRVWNASHGRLIGGPFPHNAGVDAVAFHPLGRALATTSADGAARIWQIDEHDSSPVTIQHSAHIGQVVFHSKGHFLLTVSQDRVVRAWDSQTGLPVIESLRHPIRVQHAGFHPDHHETCMKHLGRISISLCRLCESIGSGIAICRINHCIECSLHTSALSYLPKVSLRAAGIAGDPTNGYKRDLIAVAASSAIGIRPAKPVWGAQRRPAIGVSIAAYEYLFAGRVHNKRNQ